MNVIVDTHINTKNEGNRIRWNIKLFLMPKSDFEVGKELSDFVSYYLNHEL